MISNEDLIALDGGNTLMGRSCTISASPIFQCYDPYAERIRELEKLVEHYASMVEHLQIQAKEAGLNTEPMSLSEMFTN